MTSFLISGMEGFPLKPDLMLNKFIIQTLLTMILI